MTAPAPLWTLRIPATGPLVLRRAMGEIPTHHQAFGPNWAIALPPELWDEGTTLGSNGIEISPKAAAEGQQARIDGFWKTTMAALRPDPFAPVPHSLAGTTAGSALSPPAPDESHRAGQVRDHLRAQARDRQAQQRPAFVNALLRQLSVLRLAADAKARLWRDRSGTWVLQFHEEGRMTALFDELTWSKEKLTPPLRAFPVPHGEAEGKARLIALARAVQIARIALTCRPGAEDPLRIETGHADLGREVMALDLPPARRGLPLERLARRVASAMFLGLDLPEEPQLLPFRPVLAAPGQPPKSAQEGPISPVPPIRWRTIEEDPSSRWIYAGAVHEAEQPASGLPFALTLAAAALPARDGIPYFHGLPAADRAAYVDWLSGPRRSQGARPVFCHLYLQGLEYRLLADTPGTDEALLLRDEIAAMAVLLPPAAPEHAAALGLLDWLVAIGKAEPEAIIGEGPLSCLVRLGRRVAEGGSLSPTDIRALARHHPPDEVGLPPEAGPYLGEAEGGRNEDEDSALHRIAAPRVALIGRYRSLSGLCDVDRRVFRREDQPLPDLRASARLARLLRERLPQDLKGQPGTGDRVAGDGK